MKNIISLFVLFSAPAAFAKPFVLLNDPSKIECKLESELVYPTCNIIYDGVLVYEGSKREPAVAGADCLTCRNVKEEAITRQAHVSMDRALNWNSQNFLTLTFADSVTPVCEAK